MNDSNPSRAPKSSAREVYVRPPVWNRHTLPVVALVDVVRAGLTTAALAVVVGRLVVLGRDPVHVVAVVVGGDDERDERVGLQVRAPHPLR